MVSRNVGHTIQSVLNNTPVFVSANNTTSAVVTSGGAVYQSGLIGNKVQANFEDVRANVSVIGKVTKAELSEENIMYLLTAHGAVYAYDYQAASCSPIIKEIYAPEACGCDNDKAVDIDAGRAHVVILTENGKVFGAGCNGEYQLVPQGQCNYKTAVQLLVTDTLVHDNRCCDTLIGNIQPTECPKPNVCKKPTCVQGLLERVELGYIELASSSNGSISLENIGGPTSIDSVQVPVFADVSYVGFVCCGEMDETGLIPLRGSMTVTVNTAYTLPGAYPGAISNGLLPPTLYTLTVRSGSDVSSYLRNLSRTQVVPICGVAGQPFVFGLADLFTEIDDVPPFLVNTLFPTLSSPSGALIFSGSFSDIDIVNTTGGISPNPCTGSFSDDQTPLSIDLECCCEIEACPPLPQPCFRGVYAGGDTSVLVDDCNRLYVLGAFWKVRDNKCLLKKSCLERLLADTDASISMPASQLNCCVRPQNGNCNCKQCCQKPFNTDLSQMGVNICFPKKTPGGDCGDCNGCDSGKTNICEFLNKLKECNESEQCSNTCEPCDNYIYLDLCSCACPGELAVGSVTLYNRVSVCRAVSTRPGATNCTIYKRTIPVTINSVAEVTLNGYCIDGVDVELCEIVQLVFCPSGPNVDMYVDLDKAPLGIAFRDDSCAVGPNKSCSKVVFNAFDNCEAELYAAGSQPCNFPNNRPCPKRTPACLPNNTKFLLNFGTAMDPLELSNLKQLFLNAGYFQCPQFTCPITKVINTYLKGGDRVKVVCPDNSTCLSTLRHAVTPDLPTVLRLNRPVIDVAVHNEGIVAITGSGVCPNEVYSIGQNCYGELGIKSNANTTCWVLVDRCLFDCQVYRVFAGPHVTFFVTQSGRVYGSGSWGCLVHANRPVWIESICPNWHVTELAVSQNTLLGLGEDGTLFGAGDNQLGQLGLCHTQCVSKPICLVFFNKIANRIYNSVTQVKEKFISYEKRQMIENHKSDKKCQWTRIPSCKKGKCGPKGCDCDNECDSWVPDQEPCPVKCKPQQNSYYANARLTVRRR